VRVREIIRVVVESIVDLEDPKDLLVEKIVDLN